MGDLFMGGIAQLLMLEIARHAKFKVSDGRLSERSSGDFDRAQICAKGPT